MDRLLHLVQAHAGRWFKEVVIKAKKEEVLLCIEICQYL
jgi:hypothetical protein